MKVEHEASQPVLAGKTAIFDLDMTLLEYTFGPAIFEFAEDLATETGEEIDKEAFRAEWHRIFEDFKPLMVVNPMVTTITAQILMERYGIDHQSEVGRRLLYNLNKGIYNTPAEGMKLCPGAMEAVAAADEHCAQILIGTIGRGGWTKRVKLARTGLSEYFKDDQVTCFDVNVPKSEQWAGMIEQRGLDLNEVFVVGDDLRADILPMIALGAKVAVWVNNGKLPEEQFWAYEVPEGVIKVETLWSLLPLISSRARPA